MRWWSVIYGLGGLLICVINADAVVAADEDSAAAIAHFESEIRPLLLNRCTECHGPDAQEAGLRLDSRPGWETGGESGRAIVPGNPEDSLLIKAIRYTDEDLRMPPDERLPADEIAVLVDWVERGAADPRRDIPSTVTSGTDSWAEEFQERLNWWSLQPLGNPDIPRIPAGCESCQPVDRFLHAVRNAAGLHATSEASPEVLLRRLSFVLTGLPPGPELRKRFLADWQVDSDDAYEALVDELLDSPHFGERLARHWMDVVRYTDTYGYEWDNPAKGSWEYRDYLIRSFNLDIGYDQMVREQIAGDLLPEPRINQDEGVVESLIGPMFYHLGEHRHGSSLDFNGVHQEMIDNKIDAFSKTFLGMTVACARCHDHKLDAISQEDYYALAGVFMTPRWTSRPIDAPDRYEPEISELRDLRDVIAAELKQAWRQLVEDGAFQAPKVTQTLLEGEVSGIDDIGYPVKRLFGGGGTDPSDNWQQLAEEWRAARAERSQRNAGVTVLTDFSKEGFPAGWVSEGAGIEHGYVADGVPRVALEGSTAIAEVLPRGYHTHALSSKLPGAVRGPDLSGVPYSHAYVKIAGGEWAGSITIPQNAFQCEGPVFFDPAKSPAWTALAAHQNRNGVTRVTTEFATASLHPNFPPRTGVARSGEFRLPDDDEGFDKRSWFSIVGIAASDAGITPVDSLDEFEALYEQSPPNSMAEAWQRVGVWLGGAVERWTECRATGGDVRIINWLLTKKRLPNTLDELPQVAALVQRYRDVENRIGFPRSANSMDERSIDPVDYRLNVRGDVHRDGAAIRRNFLEAFAGQHEVGNAAGSGRLELARYLTSGKNPQTARVYVNRVWQWMFGTGIVATPNDFGHLGDEPSHPELLDWLARQFMQENWSTKQLVRQLVLSQTFRQSGTVSQAALEKDPGNRLLHHYATRRLEGEAIRDSMLAVSGRLNPELYGRPINPWRRTEDSMKRLFTGPLDSDGRRSIYLEMSIMQPPEFLIGFNLPNPKLPTGRRDVTNVPSQALILLNDPLVRSLAEYWAARLEAAGPATPRARIEQMFQSAFGRDATDDELVRWTQALQETSLVEIAHTIFNAKEFIYYR